MSQSLPRTKDDRYLSTLARLAMTVEPVRKARLAACLVRRNEIISFGTNQLKTHPIQAKYSKNPESIYLHAEVDCIKNALRLIDAEMLRSCTLYVCRVKYSGSSKQNMLYGMAKPCKGCQMAIDAFQIKRVVYSKDDHNINF